MDDLRESSVFHDEKTLHEVPRPPSLADGRHGRADGHLGCSDGRPGRLPVPAELQK